VTAVKETMLQHLLWHKALTADADDGARINRYLQMVTEIEQGRHVALADPFEKSIAAAFELVIEEQMDPWDLNLTQFTRLFLERKAKEGGVNFVTAGKLVAMAWEILRRQADYVLAHSKPAQEFVESAFADWDLAGILETAPTPFDFSEAVMMDEIVPLHEAVRRAGHRAVSLVELMDAFQEAEVESKRQLELNSLREKARAARHPGMGDKVHGEDLTDDIALAWERIQRFQGEPVRISDLWEASPWDRVTVFVAVLFLVKFGKLKAWQESYPRGEILVQTIAGPAPAENAPMPAALAAGVA